MNKLFLSLLFALLNICYLVTYATSDRAISEFPATVGTVPNETHETSNNDGLVLEWEDGNVSDFLSQVKNVFNAEFDSIDFFGMFDSDSSKNIDPHSYHRDSANKSQETQETYEADPTAQIINADASDPKEQEEDWRYNRKWWQRGAPVL